MSNPDQKPIIDKVRSYIPDTNDVKDAFKSATQSISNGIENVKSGVQNSLGEFSQKGVVNASNEFLESNGLFAKFAFLILVLIVFLFLFKVGMSLIAYFSQPSGSPFLIKGTLDGNTLAIISQDPKNKDSVPILRSVNEKTGIEYTWSVWLLLKYNQVAANTKADTIFAKGPIGNFNATNGFNGVNGPGLYVAKVPDGTVSIGFLMDDVVNNDPFTLILKKQGITIDNLPLNKWVHVAFRLENKVVDAYVNGVITKRLQLLHAPKQNFYDVLACGNGGFQGTLSNLQYFNRALNVFEINNIVMFGPNLTSSKQSSGTVNATGNYSYLSNSWYSGWYNAI